jgi:hypothetical protein
MRILLAGLLLAFAAVSPAAAQAPTPCTFSAKGTPWGVSYKGRLTCAVARTALRSFVLRKRSPSGWKCRSGRNDERFDSVCRRRDVPQRVAYATRFISTDEGQGP